MSLFSIFAPARPFALKLAALIVYGDFKRTSVHFGMYGGIQWSFGKDVNLSATILESGGFLICSVGKGDVDLNRAERRAIREAIRIRREREELIERAKQAALMQAIVNHGEKKPTRS